MRLIAGKKVYTSLEEIVGSGHTALIVVDVQNDFVKPEGVLEKHSVDPLGKPYVASMSRAMLVPLRNLIDEARKRDIPVVYIRSTQLPGHRSEAPSLLHLRYVRWAAPPLGRVVEGTWGHQVVDEIAPEANDIQITKHRASAFVGTPLDAILRSNNIDSVVVTGLATEGCVLATALGAAMHDYYVTVARDCVATTSEERHEKVLEVLSYLTNVVTSDEIISVWKTAQVVDPSNRKSERLGAHSG